MFDSVDSDTNAAMENSGEDNNAGRPISPAREEEGKEEQEIKLEIVEVEIKSPAATPPSTSTLVKSEPSSSPRPTPSPPPPPPPPPLSTSPRVTVTSPPMAMPTTRPSPPPLFQPFLPSSTTTSPSSPPAPPPPIPPPAALGGGHLGRPALPFSIDNILKPTFGQRLLLHSLAAAAAVRHHQQQQQQQQQLVLNGDNIKREPQVSPDSGKHGTRGNNGTNLNNNNQPVDLSSKKERASSSSSSSSSVEPSPSIPGKTSKTDPDVPPGMVRGPNGQLWPAWVFCTRYSDRPSSGELYTLLYFYGVINPSSNKNSPRLPLLFREKEVRKSSLCQRHYLSSGGGEEKLNLAQFWGSSSGVGRCCLPPLPPPPIPII